MKRAIVSVAMICATILLLGCTKQSDQPLTATNQPQSSAASQTQASQTAPQPQAVSATQQSSPQPSVESASDAASAVKACPEPYHTYCDQGDILGESLAQWKADNPELHCVPQGENKWKSCTFQENVYDGVFMNTETVTFLNGRLSHVTFSFDRQDRQKVQEALVPRFGEPESKTRMLWGWENSQSFIMLQDNGLSDPTLIFGLKENRR